MSKWKIERAGPADPAKTRRIAHEIWKGLVYFAILRTHDPKKKAALEKLTTLRLEIQEALDVLAPGYMESEGDVHG